MEHVKNKMQKDLETIKEKIEVLQEIMRNRKIIVAFSGGFDSSMLLHFTKKFALEVIAIMVKFPYTISREIEHAKKICNELAVPLKILSISLEDHPDIYHNYPLRCYYCKKAVLSRLLEEKKKLSFDVVIDGSQTADLSEHRPGIQALKELNILSPFIKANLSKSDLYRISKQIGFPKKIYPANSCLATRIPYNHDLSCDVLQLVNEAEETLLHLIGTELSNIRVRVVPMESKKYLALIEGDRVLLDFLMEDRKNWKKINSNLKKLGFAKISIDLEGRQ